MKTFFILLFVGVASAVSHEDFRNEAKNAVDSFMNGLNTATPLHVALGIDNSEDVQRLERDIKEELKKHIEEAFEKALRKIEDAIKNNKNVNEKALLMLKELKEKMKDLNIEDHEVTEELEALKAKVDDHLRMILEKMGIFDKRSADPDMPEVLQSVFGDGSIKELLLKLKNMIFEKLNVKTFKDAIVRIIGQVTQRLCNWITTKGKEKVLNVLDNFFDADSDAEIEQRVSEDRYREIKDYLENIEQNIQDKLARLKKWLDDLLNKGINDAKEEVQKVVKIIKEIIAESKNASKEELVNILEHIKDFEDKFGSLYDLRDVIQEFLKKKY